MTNNDTFAKRLIQRRAEEGYSQEELSKISGIAAAQISRYEAGINKPRANIVAKLAEALNVPFNWLSYGDETGMVSLRTESDEHICWLYLEPRRMLHIKKLAKESNKSIDEMLASILHIGLESFIKGESK